PAMQDVLEQVLDQAATGSTRSRAGQAAGGVHEGILEVRVGGQRYRVIRYALAAPALPLALSPRERGIVRLVAKGLPNKAIASVLEISAWTVATHLRRIFAKLEVNSRAEMVARAVAAGLLMGSEPALPE